MFNNSGMFLPRHADRFNEMQVHPYFNPYPPISAQHSNAQLNARNSGIPPYGPAGSVNYTKKRNYDEITPNEGGAKQSLEYDKHQPPKKFFKLDNGQNKGAVPLPDYRVVDTQPTQREGIKAFSSRLAEKVEKGMAGNNNNFVVNLGKLC